MKPIYPDKNSHAVAPVTTPKAAPVAVPVDPAKYQTNVQTEDPAFYRHNIVTKAKGEDYVVYEYSDVRIDKVATLAAKYCYDTNPGKKAYLRDIYLNKNHKRRATFDCVDLATQ